VLDRSYFKVFIYFSFAVLLFELFAFFFFPKLLWTLVFVTPFILIGLSDCFQTKHSILRNYPLLGRLRFFMEDIRPEIQQYFVESDIDGKPFNRQQRSVVYQRSKNVSDTMAFGTIDDIYGVGYEWVNHSFLPKQPNPESLKVLVGGPQCSKPYTMSIFYISAMSYGALSSAAVRAMNGGAKLGNFPQNTGEGGLSPYHLESGADLIWQVGTGYFGCRTPDGKFDPVQYKEKAVNEHVKMIELKLSQGAKPGHGGILPKEKITEEIARIRTVPMGGDILSPPNHSAFTSPIELCEFVQQLREMASGKPVGIKLCIGKRREFLAICKAILETGIYPDFITVDGGEGGTGAAPLEFSNHVGCPQKEALIFVHNALVGFGIRDKIVVSSNSKVVTGFDLISRLAIGADVVGAGRSFMMAVGCIQARKCNKNTCPVGVTTQNPDLMRGLHVESKKTRVYQYHKNTLFSAAEILGAMGLEHTAELRPWHVMRRVGPTQVMHYGEIYHYLKARDLLEEPLPQDYARAIEAAQATTFNHAHPD